jgi:acyl dehydratase
VTVYADDVPVGFEVPSFGRTITREMALTHGAPMKNFHTVVEDAQAMGFPDVVIAGPMFVCFYSEMFTRFFGAGWVSGGRLDFKLYKPVFANQTLTARAVVSDHELLEEGVRVVLEVWCEREEDGIRTNGGTASVLLQALPPLRAR